VTSSAQEATMTRVRAEASIKEAEARERVLKAEA
jgi:hypothetical protein